MRISTQTEALGKRLGEEMAVRMVCATGFDAIDFSMFHMQTPDCSLLQNGFRAMALELNSIAKAYGCYFNQTHAPFPSYAQGDEEYNNIIFQKILRAMEISSLLGARAMIVHPIAVEDTNRQKEINLEFYNRLLPYCKSYNVKVALENMWGWDASGKKPCKNVCSSAESFAEYLDCLDSDYFTACLDLGHCGIVGETAPEMIRDLGGKRLSCLHVHDNDGFRDSHTLPYLGNMDWPEIMAALAQIDYTGELTFEADNFLSHFPDELLTAALSLMHETGRTLVEKFEA